MYRHPEVQYAELGMGGRNDRLVVWLFGEEWTTQDINLQLMQWYALCLTWSHTRNRPALYVNGSLINMTAAYTNIPPVAAPMCCQLAPNGSLTLGVGHTINNGNIEIIKYSGMVGKISLFRMWGRERSTEEVTSLSCTEGDLVKWVRDNWDTKNYDPVRDTSLQCEWSFYEVNLQFVIMRTDKNTTEHYIARDIAHRWLRQVLPTEIYLHRVSVFEVTRSDTEEHIKTPYEDELMHWAPENISRFRCLVYTSVIPKWDVAAVQTEMYTDLSNTYTDPSGLLLLLADTSSIYTTPVEKFSMMTISPQVVTTASAPVTTSTPTTMTSSAFTQLTTLETSTISIISGTKETATNPITRTPGNVSELYFEVQMNVSITGECDPQQILPYWLNISLPDDLMMVLDLQLLPKPERRHPERKHRSNQVFINEDSRESFVFQVQVLTQLDQNEIENKIRNCLQSPYDNGLFSITAHDIRICPISVIQCAAEAQQTLKGLFMWPDTLGRQNATHPCPKAPQYSATRLCKLSQRTHWMEPNLENCPPLVETIPDLDHVEVTPENAFDVLKMIKDLMRNHSSLIYKELVTVLNKLKDIISVSVVTPDLGQALIDTISNILESDSNLGPFTNTILNLTEEVGDKMVGFKGSYTLGARAIAISVVDVSPGPFSSLSFGVLSDWSGNKPEIFINRYPSDGMVAFISLPSALQNNFPQNGLNQNQPRIQFQFYANPLLFKYQVNEKEPFLSTFVVSASVSNASSPIKDLHEEVKVMLHHLQPSVHDRQVQCVYWNFNKNNGHGGWDDHGCRKYNSTPDYTTCLCDHLTHFGVLLDVSRTQLDPLHEQILTIITYVGCGVSSLFLGITILTYIAFEKLRRDYPSQILINLSLALLGLNLMFLINSWLSSWSVYSVCVAAASLLHYFLLASFTWMGLEAVNMYFALVKVFNVYVPSYILKFCALGWGIPLVICIMVLIVNRDAYGSFSGNAEHTFQPLDNSDNFCWVQDNVTYYVSVVAYAGLIFLFNIGVFVVVLIQIRRMRFNSPAGTRRGVLQDLKGAASLTFLLGLTWTVGFFTWAPARAVLMYLFAGLNTLQGLFVFLFHCLMKENVRKQWRIHLCFGRFRLEEHSEWSNSASVRVLAKPKEKFLRAAIPSVRSVKSNSTNSTSASSDSSQRDSSCRRPNLDLFVNSLVLPRAQTGAPDTESLNPTSG
ncbi:adhesion G-protein coupled receptor G4 [Xiphophorus couchianus]|uniref:adhesion G-protein coupled receptor G4 n=1 Tax=Xiphophorus couchianus TaxID=32473 RepID=UPI001015F5B3|nr:adhesion G-protein coupled receptor G4-like [Xiphophorus couchianus]